jgi:hypothetical protein
VPLLPQLFDTMLLAWTLVTDRRKLRAIELLQSEAQRVFRARPHVHRFGGTEFRVGTREPGHRMAMASSMRTSGAIIAPSPSRQALLCRTTSSRSRVG